jgi:Ca2+-binding EF-hand superfamily protein
MAQTGGWKSGRACLFCPGISDVELFRYCQSIVDFDPKIADEERAAISAAQSSTRQGTRIRRRSCVVQIRTGKGHPMISRRTLVLALTAGASLAGGSPVLAKSRHSNWIRMFDTDNDGTVDLAEAKKAASALFDKLDRDHDGTLDKRELARRLTQKELAAADLDHDGTLTKDEYLAVVEQRFSAADPDHDGTLDAKELNSKAGQALLRLLK